MKKIITLLLLICLTSGITAQNHFYDTEVVDANGNTLYFLLNDDLVTASVTYPNLYTSSPWDGYTKPTGSVVIPSSVDIYGYDYPVTRVDDHAFDGCSGITAITLPPQLTDILTYAFRNCTGISSITFPNTLRTVGEYGFYGCTGLTSVLLPPLVSHVSNYVFYGCTNLSTALINDVHTIGNYAFKNCTSLATVSMNSVTNIGNYSFESDAVLNNVSLPNSLLTIGEYAFHSCTSLSSIAIPINVTQIGNRAFQGCTLLTNLQFNATRCMTMGSSSYPVFDGCNYINSLTIGNNVQRIPDYAFKNITGSMASVNIPDSVVYIGQYSFQSCSGLQSVTIGRGVDSIGQNAFTSCTSLTTVGFNADSCRWVGGSPNASSGNNGRVFYGDNLFTTLNIGNNVKVIPNNLFNDCSHIASIAIPNSVIRIGNYAFYSCDGATSLSLGSGLRSIGDHAFDGCTLVPSIITQGNNLQTIGTYAFSGCSAANTISVNAYTIGGYAFQNCTSAASVTSGNISVTAQTIGTYAFSGCSKANTISVEAYSIDNYAFKNCTSAASVTSGNISVNAQTIGTEAFYGCSKADTIFVEAYTIGNSAFRNCTSAASVTLGNSVHTIVQYAFYNCSTLPNITIPAAVDSIGYRAFGGCAQLTQVYFNADSCSYMSPDGVFQGTPVSRVVVGNGVKNIPDNAFNGLTSLSQVVFSSTVKRIGSYAFNGCTGLRAPTLSSQLTTIENYAFSGCNNLTFASIMIPANVRRIGNYAFRNCSNLQRVVFMAQNCIEMGSASYPVFYGCNNLVRLVTGNGVTNIPDHAFRGVSSLHSPLLVPTIQNIGDYAFYGCSSIDTIWTRGATKTIGDYAFRGCSQAYVLILSDQIDSIGTYAFYQCSALPSIEIPNSVKFIGASAFQSCSALTSVYSKMRQIPSMSGDIFENSTRSSATLTVPCNMTSRYRANSYWNFTTIQEDNNCQTSFLVSAIPNHTEWGSVMGSGIYSFGDTATLTAIPDSGYVFWKWDDGATANPRHIDVTDSMEFVAIFGHSPVGTIPDGTRKLMEYVFNAETKPYTPLVNDVYCPSSVTDIDGNTYNTVRIGIQCWMAENLRTTKYADGTDIALGSGTSTSVAYRYYPNNSSSNVANYGYLYNWKAVMRNSSSSSANPSGVQGICPTGWHVPSTGEWTELTSYVSSQSQYTCNGNFSNIAKALASTTGWNSHTGTCAIGNTPSDNNTTGFSAVPAGYYNGSSSFGNYADFWSSTQSNSSSAYYRYLDYNSASMGSSTSSKSTGYSVRCLRDNGAVGSGAQTPTPTVTTAVVSSITSQDNACGTITLPFDFPFGLTTFNAGTTLGVSSNGYLVLGSTSTSSTLNGTSSSYNIINPIINSDAYSWVVYYQSSNDSVIIEYVGLRSYSSPYDNMNYQVRLYPSGIIQIHYGSNTHSNSSTYWRCFMREYAHSDYFYVTGSWNNPDGKVAAVSTPTGVPSEGLLYTFYPSIDTTYNSSGETPVDTTVTPVQVTVTVNASPSACGTASGGGTYWSGDTITLTATPEYGFRFVNWSDGHTENPYSYIVGNVGTSITAYFDTASFNVSITANNPEMGNLTGSGSGIYKYLRTLNFSAQPHEGYIFAGWNDGVTNPNRTVTVTRDTVIQALFADPNNLMIHDTTFITVPVHDTTFVDVPVHDTTYVSVHDTTFVPVHDTTYVTQFDTTYINVTIHDTTYVDVPYPVHDTTYVDVPYPVHDTTYVDVPYPVHDTTYVTQFDTTYINVTIHDTTYVDVPYPVHDTTYVDVPYPVHDTTFVTQFDTTYINITVHDTTYVDVYVTVHDTTYVDVPYPVHDTTYVDVPYPVHDTTYVTQFDTTYINVTVHDTTYVDVYVTVHDTTYVDVPYPVHDTTYVDVPYPVHDTTYVTQFDTTYINVTIHDTTYVDVPYPVHDTTYVDVPYPVHDTTYVTQFDTIYVTQFDTVSVTLYDTTYITVHDTVTLQPDMYTITVYSNNPQYGLAAGNGEFPEGSVVEIAAIPIEGYHFEQWQDGNTQNPRSVTLTEDKTFIATFGTVGIASPEIRTYDVYAVKNEIVVRNAAGSRVRIFDAKGSLLSCEQSVLDEYRFPVLATGTYFVQVDNDSACKVVVVRQ